MKRDWDLIREILLKAENLPPEKDSVVRPKDFEEYAPEMVIYHFELLEQAGLVDAKINKPNNNRLTGLVFGLTWEGHDFLDAIRRETVWQKIQVRIKQDGAALPFELLKATAIQLVRELLTG